MRTSVILGLVALASSISAIMRCGGQEPVAKAGASPIQIRAARDLVVAPSTLDSLRRTFDRPHLAAGETSVPIHPNDYAMLSLEFANAAACQAFKLEGHKLITRFDKFADVFVPLPPAPPELVRTPKEFDARLDKLMAQFDELKGPNGLLWAEIDGYTLPPPARRPIPSKETSRAGTEKIAQGGASGLTGKGVIIAIVDSGLDFRHPDFIRTDAQGQPESRLLYFWDTTSDSYANGLGEPSKYTYPNGAPIGTIYDRKTMTDDIKGGKLRIPVWDTNGHGTGCASVAAGNGRASPNYKGVAPEADLIAVRIGSGDITNPMLENSYMINAICEWLDQRAGNQPLVVSCSFGGPIGGRDGQRVKERQLSARFPLDRKGCAICFSAGNNGLFPHHASMKIGPATAPAKITWSIPIEGRLAIYVQTENDSDLYIEPLRATELNNENFKSYIHSLTKHVVIEIDVKAAPGGVQMNSKSGQTYTGDAYLAWDGFMPFRDKLAGFDADCADFSKQIGSPGSAVNVLTVGSYDWNDQFDIRGTQMTLKDVFGEALQIGKVSSYSNPGPLRYGGAVKPEIVAPGQWYTAAAPLNVNPDRGRDGTNHYQTMNGTSSATPFAAGVIALMFQKAPSLTWGEVRKILIESATKNNPITGKCPNPLWGNGKLDLPAVERAITSVKK